MCASLLLGALDYRASSLSHQEVRHRANLPAWCCRASPSGKRFRAPAAYQRGRTEFRNSGRHRMQGPTNWAGDRRDPARQPGCFGLMSLSCPRQSCQARVRRPASTTLPVGRRGPSAGGRALRSELARQADQLLVAVSIGRRVALPQSAMASCASRVLRLPEPAPPALHTWC